MSMEDFFEKTLRHAETSSRAQRELAKIYSKEAPKAEPLILGPDDFILGFPDENHYDREHVLGININVGGDAATIFSLMLLGTAGTGKSVQLRRWVEFGVDRRLAENKAD